MLGLHSTFMEERQIIHVIGVNWVKVALLLIFLRVTFIWVLAQAQIVIQVDIMELMEPLVMT
ncbi:MAG: hypothetical protein II109_00800 [Paludibacteraceae bacterium]|nr:hypothetical protein [Paludibacteraceae bacterium]